MITYSLFVVDDEETIREGIELALGGRYAVTGFSNAGDAIDAVRENPPDLVLLDIGLPDMNGIEALSRIKGIKPDIVAVMVTAYEDVNSVVSAMKLGAYDYVVKPIHMDALKITIANALGTVRLRKEVMQLQESYLSESVPCFIGESNIIQNVMEFIGKVAQSPDTPIFISGETGTGKELIASAIHYRSPNFKGPFVAVNCAAIPKELIESELFGYEQGAFTGASSAGKTGLIEAAAHGTLFLDEIGDLSLEAQAKLLRFLEEGEFYRVGGTETRKVTTRIVSATNKDIEEMIGAESFRKDLYFRLGVIKVEVPSLRERGEDIIHLAKYFLNEFNEKFNRTFAEIGPSAERMLLDHEWSGNVRELKNLIERGVLIGKGDVLQAADLGLTSAEADQDGQQRVDGLPRITEDGFDLQEYLQLVEKECFDQALDLAEGNESKAARILGMNHHTFRYRKKKFEK